MDKNSEAQANKEYWELLKKRAEIVAKRREELKKTGLTKTLDGPDPFRDIEDWFNEKFIELKKRYSVS